MESKKDSNFDDYLSLSHELAKKQLIERFMFEIHANRNILRKDNDLTLDDLIDISHNIEVFTDKEYKDVYEISMRELAKNIEN